MKITNKYILVIGVLLVLPLVYWGWHCAQSSFQSPPPSSDLLPIPEPNLDNLESSVQERLQGARVKFEQQRKNEANHAQAYGTLGMMYHAHQLAETASPCYLNAHKLHPEDFRWCYYLALLTMEAGEYEQTISYLKETMEHLPERHTATPSQRVVVLYYLGEMYLARNEWEPAQKSFEQALAEDTTCVGARVGLGQVAAVRGDSERAVSHWEQALTVVPSAQTLHYLLATEYRKLGNDKQSEHHLKEMDHSTKLKLIPADPLFTQLRMLAESANLYVHQGNVAFQAKQFEAAAKAFRNALAMDSEDPSIRAKLAATLVTLNDVDQAREEYGKVLEQDPKNVMANYGLGVLAAQDRNDDVALNYYHSVLDVDPNHQQARFNLANSLIRLGKYQDSASHFQQVIKRSPDNADARLGHAMCLLHLNQFFEALETLQEARTAVSDHAGVKHVLARLLVTAPEESVRNGTEGLRLAEELVRVEARLDYVETLAMAYAEVGRFQEAIELQRKMITSAQQAKRHDHVTRLQNNLKLYEQNRPCRAPLP